MKSVAVITRTKDRPVMLARALRSVSAQTFNDFQWVIVNDGGCTKPVDNLACEAQDLGVAVSVIHNPKSVGMEAASNIGIRESDSTYIVIHDDDDSWQSSFLQKTVEALEKVILDSKGRVLGLVTLTRLIDEFVNDSGEVREVGSRSYNPQLRMITLVDIANLKCNPPPISFLFSRSVVNEIGVFDERLPVLGDWDFYLRFLCSYEISVLREELANYHIRPSIKLGNYGNSIIARKDDHKLWESYIINKYLLEDIRNNRFGLGVFLNQNKNFSLVYYHVEIIRRISNVVRWVGYKVRSGRQKLKFW